MTGPAAVPWRRGVDRWQLRSTAPGRFAGPAEIDADTSVDWHDVRSGTVAAMLREAGLWHLDGAPRRFDAEDWWLRTRIEPGSDDDGPPTALHLEGLAGLADVWVNGHHLLRSENMFLSHAVSLQDAWHAGGNELHLRFASLDAALSLRKPRPRWRAPMVEHQQLRWQRQTLLGRTPGWSPPAAAVGPWRDVWLECAGGAPLHDVDVHAELGADGAGTVAVSLRCDRAAVRRIDFELSRGGRVHGLALDAVPGAHACWQGRLHLDEPVLWWPHTHGEPALYAARLRVIGEDGDELEWPLPAVGFRRLALDATAGDFSLSVNGVAVFCRGACWMPLDAVALRAGADAYRAALAQVRDAGMNMLRVCGPTIYEAPAFYEACDEAGVLVWQDFMFANMDYPADDPAFFESVRLEVAQQLSRWRAHPSLAVLCGNSEVEQQAAMWGAPRAYWAPALFHETLRRWCAEQLPDVPYWPSSAHGGAFPHQADEGTTSYYGVGAYLRSCDDARRARPRFATECLGFANVPETTTIARMPHGDALRVHHPGWKARTPRDLGAGWDFEDVRDHYLRELYGVDPLQCRYADHERYLSLGRVVTGEVMAAAFAEWRRPGSGCRGALVWHLRDLWAGAGWGLLDDVGQPKACWWWLRRAMQPRALLLTDEGGNGLAAHLTNDGASPVEGLLRLSLFGASEARVADAECRVEVQAHCARTVPLAGLFDGFIDLGYSYRFGPPAVTLVHAQWLDAHGQGVAEAFHFPAGRPSAPSHGPLLDAAVEPQPDGSLRLRLQAARFVQALQIEIDGWSVSDNYFHMAPGSQREVVARPCAGASPSSARGWLRPLNATSPMPLRWMA